MGILFLGDYPDNSNIKEGMMQRIAAVDVFFKEIERKYIAWGLFRNFKRKVFHPAPGVTCMRLNILLHFFELVREFRKSYPVVYSHSVYSCLPLYLAYRFCKKELADKIIVLDVHGIVPEELALYKGWLALKLFSRVEKWAFQRCDKAIFVTHKMKDYLLAKYPLYKGKNLVYNIFPISIVADNVQRNFEGVDDKKNIVIYSGNTQKWQNIELMLDVIGKNQSKNIEYIILTGEKERFAVLLKERNLTEQVQLMSLPPTELPGVYNMANYGFILRDEIPINMVANPTKLVEYLHFGIIPIVLTENIGDFYELGYEFVPVKNFSIHLPKIKSEKNSRIVQQLKMENMNADLYSFVLG